MSPPHTPTSPSSPKCGRTASRLALTPPAIALTNPRRAAKWRCSLSAPSSPHDAGSGIIFDMGASPVTKLSVEEYLAADRAAELKSEYHDGELFPLVAVSLKHVMIHGNAFLGISASLAGSPCRIALPIRVRVSPTQFVYPDLVVF